MASRTADFYEAIFSTPSSRSYDGVTLAYNARSKEEVLAVFERVKAAGARIANAAAG